MLTKKQISDLPPGEYPNWRLQKMFPNQQGPGRSSRMQLVTKTDGNGKEVNVPVLMSFFHSVASKLKRK